MYCLILSLLTHLDGFLVNFVGSSTELLQSPVGILPVCHYNICTATWRDHLTRGIRIEKGKVYINVKIKLSTYIKVQGLLASALLDLLSVSSGCFFIVNSTNLTLLGVTVALQGTAEYKVKHENVVSVSSKWLILTSQWSARNNITFSIVSVHLEP